MAPRNRRNSTISSLVTGVGTKKETMSGISSSETLVVQVRHYISARLTSLFYICVILSFIYLSLQWMNNRLDRISQGDSSGWIFKRADVARIANEARLMGGTSSEMLENATNLFKLNYPGLIHDTEWIFIRAGGWMGAFKLLYASTTEYLLLFGTGVSSSGHSGRYLATVEDTLLCGSFRQWREGTVEPVMHLPGPNPIIHERYEATGVEWEANTYMVETAHGFIPTTLPFALGDVLLSAQDFYAAWRALVVYARLVTFSILQGRF
jgi:hypothetical protein